LCSTDATTLVLDNVTVEQTTILAEYLLRDPPGSAPITGNLGECLAISADGANDTTVLPMTDSSFTGCDNNGNQETGNQETGNQETGNGVSNLHNIVVNIDNSAINGSRFHNLWLNDVTPLTNFEGARAG
jgi:hypothetical protein